MLGFTELSKLVLSERIHEFLNLIHGWKYSAWGKENFLYELPGKWNFSFFVEDQKSIKGFCVASNKIPDVYYIHLIFIAPENRGNDLGKRMIEHAKKIALDKGIRKIELRCPESNSGSLAFYKRVGFEVKEVLRDEVSGNESDYYLVYNF